MGNNLCPYKKNICDICYENGRNISVLQLNQKVLMANIIYARSAGLCFCPDQSELPEDIKCDLKDVLNKESFSFEEQKKSDFKDISTILNDSQDRINSAYVIKMM